VCKQFPTDREGDPVASVHIGTLIVSYATEQKLLHRHQISLDELEEAVIARVGLRCTWDDDPKRGRRLLVETAVRRRRVLVVLYPTGHPHEWNLGSAYFT
jgi:hypothetical protein